MSVERFANFLSLTHLGRLVAALVCVIALTACDGGNNSPTQPPELPATPTLTLTPQSVKTFHLSWSDASGETEYRVFEDLDGASGPSDYTLVATVPADTTQYDHVVFLPDRAQARYKLQACNSGGCSDYPMAQVTGNLVAAIGRLVANNGDVGDAYGGVVVFSRDGSTLAVGVPAEASSATGINGNGADNSAAGSGAVYVYTRVPSSTSSWTLQAYIKASNTEAGDGFGSSIALSSDGSTLAVGAPGEDGATPGVGSGDPVTTNNAAPDTGALYVFTRSSGGTPTWTQQAYIKASSTGMRSFPSGPIVSLRLGASVALSGDGNILAAGANGETNGSTPYGAVYTFKRTDTQWQETAKLLSSPTIPGSGFGSKVVLSEAGDVLAASAPEPNGNQPSTEEFVEVFGWDGASQWVRQARLRASNPQSHNNFGYSMALAADGKTLAVGALNESSSSTGVNGDQTNPDIGQCSRYPRPAACYSGAAYVFVVSSASGTPTWSQQAYIKASNTYWASQFGTGVALSHNGDTLVVGASAESVNDVGINPNQSAIGPSGGVGAVYLFKRATVSGAPSWAQTAFIKAPTVAPGGGFGSDVSLSGDASLLAVGAPRYEQFGSARGAVYLY